jgi:hypothetical protein
MLVLLLFCSALAFGQGFRLYLKDGDYQIVREYQVQGDRVRYFTTERGDWEEIPVSLVDLDKTEKERAGHNEEAKKEAQQDAEEAEAMRALKREIASVPQDTGAYFTVDNVVKPLEASQYKVITNKTRQVVKVLVPVPLVPGKASVVIEGEHSKFIVHDDKPNFYFRPEREERFGIVRVAAKKGHRVVENISILPAVNEGIGERDDIAVFQQQLAENLYKVWPEKPIPPGEYAVVEFTDDLEKKDDQQLMVWDFARAK